MDNLVSQFLKESIEMELNVGDLYQLFSVKFPEDHDFWWEISIEEMNHAALIKSINDIFLDEGVFNGDILERQIENLRKMNNFVKERITQYKIEVPMRKEAFLCSMELENSIGESHFEHFMTEDTNSVVVKIFQRLNGEDVNHAIRIENYMKSIT